MYSQNSSKRRNYPKPYKQAKTTHIVGKKETNRNKPRQNPAAIRFRVICILLKNIIGVLSGKLFSTLA